MPGTFKHALDYLIDHEIDLSGFDGWKLYCVVHNIEKLAHHGYGQ